MYFYIWFKFQTAENIYVSLLLLGIILSNWKGWLQNELMIWFNEVLWNDADKKWFI